MSRPEVVAGHARQVKAYGQAAAEFPGPVLAGGDWNEVMDQGDTAVSVTMHQAGLRKIANGHLDALFASAAFSCQAVQVLHPPKPADHPWLLVTVVIEGRVLRVLVANTHVGNAIGLLEQAKRRYKPHLVLTCENQRPVARKALRRAFPRITWAAAGFQPPATNPGSAGTQVLARRTTFRLIATSNELVSPYLDRMHPVRRLTYADLRLRTLPGRRKLTLRAISAHTWTLHG